MFHFDTLCSRFLVHKLNKIWALELLSCTLLKWGLHFLTLVHLFSVHCSRSIVLFPKQFSFFFPSNQMRLMAPLLWSRILSVNTYELCTAATKTTKNILYYTPFLEFIKSAYWSGIEVLFLEANIVKTGLFVIPLLVVFRGFSKATYSRLVSPYFFSSSSILLYDLLKELLFYRLNKK